MKKLGILFDLDGTLLDTAQDFMRSINLMRSEYGKSPLSFMDFRKHAYGESNLMVSYGLEISTDHPDFITLRDKFLSVYHHNSTQETQCFPGIMTLLNYLDSQNIPWGIVSNKPAYLMQPVTAHFDFDRRSKCIIAGDTLSSKKPAPEPLLYACALANMMPENTVYVGDLETDIIAARAAGMKSIAVTYGYHKPDNDPAAWGADFVAQSPTDILSYLRSA